MYWYSAFTPCKSESEKKSKTSMHSSRMRTTRVLPVSPSMHCAGGCLLRGRGFSPGGCLLPGGLLPKGGKCLLQGGVCSHGGLLQRDVCSGGCLPRAVCHSPCQQNSGVKTLPCRSFVAGGKKMTHIKEKCRFGFRFCSV